MSRPNFERVQKALWSVVIIYLLLVIVVLPNSISLLTRQWGRYLTPIANQLGINNAWQFFSPAPAPTMYLSYTIDRGESVNDQSELPTYYFPEDGGVGHASPNYNRKIYAMRFMVIQPSRIEQFFIPWVCRMHPEAKSVTVQHIVEPVPEIETIGIGTSFRDYAEKLKFPPIEGICERGGEGT